MHYFQFNIKSYQSATPHLSNAEDLAYRRLLEHYYDTERPIKATDNPALCRRLRVALPELELVLQEFFDLTDEGWRNSYCDGVISEFHAFTQRQRANGSKGGRGRKADAKPDKPTALPKEPNPEPTINNKPLTINHEPVKKKIAALESPEGVPQSIWTDFLKLRAAKKAPLTATALRGIQREADKARITLSDALSVSCEAGWQGFRADWYAARTNGKTGKVQAESFAAQDLRAKREAWEAMTNRKWPDQDLPSQGRFDVIEAEVTTIRGIS